MRIRLLRSAAYVCLAALLTLSIASPAFAQDDATSQLSPESQAVAQAINAVRAQNGLASLSVNALLDQAAQNHVDDLIANGMYGHYGSDGSSVRTRVLRTGYSSGLVSENWVTSGSPQSAMDWWMNDWIHRVNILDSSWDEMGIGAGQVGNGYWIFVTDFANLDGQDQSAAFAAQTDAELSDWQAPESVPAGGMDYTIRAGDTLLGIGLRYGIEWQDIAVANDIGEHDVLQIDQVLRLPGIAGADVSSVAEGGLLYTVQSGDTLSGIAARHSIAWEDIATANRLGEYTVLQIGMQLRLPGVEDDVDAVELPDAEEPAASSGAGTTTARAETVVITTKLLNAVTDRESSSPMGRNAPSPAMSTASEPGLKYTVKPGDTLFTIAARNGLTWQELADSNDLGDGSLLQIGQELTLPGGMAASNPTTTASHTRGTVDVLPGDTIIHIAVRHGVNWKELLAVNGLNDHSILQPGQELELP